MTDRNGRRVFWLDGTEFLEVLPGDDDKDARIAELDDQVAALAKAAATIPEGMAGGYMPTALGQWARYKAAYERAEAAEADRDWYRSVAAHNVDAARDAKKRAEAAEARVKDLEATLAQTERSCRTIDQDRWDLLNRAEDAEVYRDVNLKRAEKAEARVRDLEEHHRGCTGALAAKARHGMDYVYGGYLGDTPLKTWVDDTKDTFTAPDGRTFRVGQRVQYVDTLNEVRDSGTVVGFFDSLSPSIEVRSEKIGTYCSRPDCLRRVWDGSEEPDGPVGTVLRDAEGDYWTKSDGEFAWEITHRDGANMGAGNFLETIHGPFVEVLEGDE